MVSFSALPHCRGVVGSGTLQYTTTTTIRVPWAVVSCSPPPLFRGTVDSGIFLCSATLLACSGQCCSSVHCQTASGQWYPSFLCHIAVGSFILFEPCHSCNGQLYPSTHCHTVQCGNSGEKGCGGWGSFELLLVTRAPDNPAGNGGEGASG